MFQFLFLAALRRKQEREEKTMMDFNGADKKIGRWLTLAKDLRNWTDEEREKFLSIKK